jgi:hypothetical protein
MSNGSTAARCYSSTLFYDSSTATRCYSSTLFYDSSTAAPFYNRSTLFDRSTLFYDGITAAFEIIMDALRYALCA